MESVCFGEQWIKFFFPRAIEVQCIAQNDSGKGSDQVRCKQVFYVSSSSLFDPMIYLISAFFRLPNEEEAIDNEITSISIML
jgi:hypothetical protein